MNETEKNIITPENEQPAAAEETPVSAITPDTTPPAENVPAAPPAPMFQSSVSGQYTNNPPQEQHPQQNSPYVYNPNTAYGQNYAQNNYNPNGYYNQNTYAPYGGNPSPMPSVKPPKPTDSFARTLGHAIGMPLCMFFIISYVVQIGFVSILKYWEQFTGSSALHLLEDSNILYILSSCISIVALTVPYIFTVKKTNSSFAELVVVKKVPFIKGAGLVMLGFGATVLCNIVSNVIQTYADSFFGVQIENPAPDYGTDPWSFALMILCVGILPAVLEEFALRGVILGALRKKFSDTLAIVISAAMFGLMHGNLQQIPFAALMGIILGYVTVYSNSLIPAVIIHGLNNIMSVIISFATVDMSPMVSTMFMLLYFALALVIGICGFILLVKTDVHAFRLSCERSENTGLKIRQFITSPWIIIFVVICLLQVLLAQGVITF